MVRKDYTKNFLVEMPNAQYGYEVVLKMGKDIFAYLNDILIDELGLERIDDHGYHEDIINFCNNASISINLPGNPGLNDYRVPRGISLNGQYVFDKTNNEGDLLTLEVLIGFQYTTDDNINYNWDTIPISKIVDYGSENGYGPSASNATASLGMQISLFYTRTFLSDGGHRASRPERNASVSGGENASYNNFTPWTESYVFGVETIGTWHGIRTYVPCRKIQDGANNSFTATVPFQRIKNATSCWFTFCNNENAMPRIGTITENGLSRKKAFIETSATKWRTYDIDDSNYDSSAVSPLRFFILDEGKYRYADSKLLQSKSFENLGDKIPTMPIFIGANDYDTTLTDLDFSTTIDGFMQISKDFKEQLHGRYIINNASYTNLGNCIIMKD